MDLLESVVKKTGYSKATIERVMGLKMYSLSNDLEKPEVKAVLNILNTYPWMIKLAEYKHDKILAGLFLKRSYYDTLIEERIEELDA